MKITKRQLRSLIKESFFKDLFKTKYKEKTGVPEEIASDFGGGSGIELSDNFEQNPEMNPGMSRRNFIKGALVVGSIAAINKGLGGINFSGGLGGESRPPALDKPFLVVHCHDVSGEELYVAVEIDKEAFELLEYILKERNPEDAELAKSLAVKFDNDVDEWVRKNIELHDYYINGYGHSENLKWGEIPDGMDPKVAEIAEYYESVVADGFDFYYENESK